MSETTTETAPTEPLDTTPAADTAPETTQTEATQETQAEAAPEQPKQRPGDRRFAVMTARTATLQAERDAERQAREEAERRAAASEALIRQLRGEDPEPKPSAPPTADLIERRANELAAQRVLNARLADIDAKGNEDVGSEAWSAAKGIMTALGATNNETFLHALAEAENSHRIFAELAENPDQLTALMAKSPAAMAAQIGRMDAKLSTPAPQPKAMSRAPTPPTPVSASAAPKEPSVYEAKDMDSFEAALRREFPGNKLFGFR